MGKVGKSETRLSKGVIARHDLRQPVQAGFGPDRRRRPWWFGLGYGLIGGKVEMHAPVDARWMNAGIARMKNPTDPKGRS